MKSMFFVSLALISTIALCLSHENPEMSTYIVFLENQLRPKNQQLLSWHNSFLPEAAIRSSQPPRRIVHSYRNVITGFAARLTPEEVKAMEVKEGFISARVQRKLSLHTTFTPEFLGLQQKRRDDGHASGGAASWTFPNQGEGVIIGLLDSGIKYDHASFLNDQGMPPPPAKWRGRCDFNGGKRKCNNKLIGARSFISGTQRSNDDVDLPWEDAFHGSHTAGTAAGSPVVGANLFGQANGTAMGIAPRAHLAMYKVCKEGGCYDGDVLAGIDAAIDDGVDVLSMSIGPDNPYPFFENGGYVGAFRAIQKGIFVSCSAGNDGPSPYSVTNDVPWVLTVGASTIDREIRATVKLGNGVELHGQSIFRPQVRHQQRPLPIVVPADQVGNDELPAFCVPGTLNQIDVKGKIVVCRVGGASFSDLAREVKDNGGAAMIVVNHVGRGYTTPAYASVVLPASLLSYRDWIVLTDYLRSPAKRHTAKLSFKGTLIGGTTTHPSAPQLGSFSSRGPSLQSPGILKPDVIGPGIDILAAWGASTDNATENPFNVRSGTSTSCRHLSGVAALIKSAHPDWSPAAIKSAILTTAYALDLRGNPISDEQNVTAAVFGVGAGHVDPSRALDPGLVYDIHPDDYIPYLCGLGYSDKHVTMIVQRKVSCGDVIPVPEAQLNYPTFSIRLGAGDRKTYTRTVTNVGPPRSTYSAVVRSLEEVGIAVTVVPSEIKFDEVNEKASYAVTFTRLDNITRSTAVSRGSLVWSAADCGYTVVSTIAVVFL